ncbi:MAG: glutamine synthetase family protein [Gammaproteobacteria bacterium]
MDSDSARTLAAWIERAALEVVGVLGSDLNGIARGKQLPAVRLAADPDALRFPELVTFLDCASQPVAVPADDARWWPSWCGGFPDLRATIDASSARVVPWQEHGGLVLCDFTALDGSARYDFLPRPMLARLCRRAERLGFKARAACELEFVVFGEPNAAAGAREYRHLQPLWSTPQAYAMTTQGRYEGVVRALHDNLAGLGLALESWGLEAGPGQLEYNLAARDAAGAADDGFLLKHAVKEITAALGLGATFMARWGRGAFGNGHHVNLSLWRDDDVNAFFDAARPGRRSALMEHFIAGVVATLGDFAVLYAPTVNSYRRFEPYRLTGMLAAWGEDNKTVAVRAVGETPARTRIECRSAGADASPHLALAACLAGGLHGVESALAPPPPVSGDAYARDDLARLPANLDEAIARFEASAVAHEYFGEAFVRLYACSRRAEAAAFAAATAGRNLDDEVTTFELARYLDSA